MRFDVFIPEEQAQPPLLRRILGLDAAFHAKDGSRVRRLGISNHILRTLQLWTVKSGLSGPDSVASMYDDLPFGSRIVFENLDLNISNIRVVVARMYPLERQLLSFSRIDSVLGLPRESLPEAIDISRLRVVRQLHDSVCLTRIEPGYAHDSSKEPLPDLWILKALTSGTKYLYHELQALLKIESHPNVISHPRFLVTKYCKFGGKTAVVGFVIPYHPGGSLRDHIPFLRLHGKLRLQDQVKWATELASAVVHVRERGRMFYTDLRLDNVVLSASSSAVMVDFEQRGVWCEFAAPEVNALEYVRILASDVPAAGDTRPADGTETADINEPTIPRDVCERYAAILTNYLPGWELLQSHEEYTLRPHGYGSYNIPWLCLSDEEQEAAEVYMLGRLLWCLFEGQAAPQPGAVWQSYNLEPDLEFPNFKRTPPKFRGLIDRCTNGRRPTLSAIIIRRENKLVLRKAPEGLAYGSAQIVQTAKDWWVKELEAAEAFLKMRDELKSRGEWPGNYFGRPKLREVLDSLRALQTEVAAV